MESEFASPEQAPMKQLKGDYENIISHDYIVEVLKALPNVAAILNYERQIVFSNDALLEFLGIDKIDNLLGRRPGEAMHCLYAENDTGGCGTTEACRYCGAVHVILESQKTGKKAECETRISIEKKNRIESLDLLVTASPIAIGGKTFTLFIVKDISDEKRRHILEKIFFHDIINTAGGLKGLTSYALGIENVDQVKKLVRDIDDIATVILDEIFAQRDLLNAEQGTLKVNKSDISSRDFITVISSQLRHFEVTKIKSIAIREQVEEFEFSSDYILFGRVMVNLLKNAIEASSRNDVVSIGCDVDHENQRFIFWVHNNSVMPRKVQMQIFQRSFSTKGKDRGLGTYSIKLITERYLGGEISFSSIPHEGTTFFAMLPMG